MRSVLIVSALSLLVPSLAFAGFRASSIKSESGRKDIWGASAAIDGDMSTCWQVDPESEQKGEWIEIDVPASEVDKISLTAGWNKDKTAHADYARIKSLRIEVYTDDFVIIRNHL